MNINQRLYKLRTKKGLSQKELADAVGLGLSTIEKIGKQNDTSVKTLIKLADYFDVSADYLIGRSLDPSSKVPILPLDQRKRKDDIFRVLMWDSEKMVNMHPAEIANVIGLPEDAVCLATMFCSSGTASTIEKLADYFEVTADFLLGRTDYCNPIAQNKSQLPEEEQNLLSLYHAMTQTQRIRFVAFGEGITSANEKKFRA